MSSLQNDLEDGSWRRLPKRFEGKTIQSRKGESRGFAHWTNCEVRYRLIITIKINILALASRVSAPPGGKAALNKPPWRALKFE
jgi:hypothetical protein